MKKYTIGLDFGTLTVRALLMDIHTGQEVATADYAYPHGTMVEGLPAGWALQHPMDYLEGMEKVIRGVMEKSGAEKESVVGIGLDFTASTVVAVKKDKTPLCCLPEFEKEPHAYVKLWKHHGAEPEAQEINEKGKDTGFMPFYGGRSASEWMLPKILETLRHAPAVFAAADYFMEAMDYVTWVLTGSELRSACGAGYKAFYRHDTGYPDKAFLKTLDPRLENLVEEKMAAPLAQNGERAGLLSGDMANTLGLLPGTPVSIGIIDAHASLIGSGISQPDTMMVIVGTSSCHMVLSETEAVVPGMAGVVKGGILPEYFAYEAGQSCVGDLYAWFTENCVPAAYKEEAAKQNISVHDLLRQKLTGYRAGASGLVALDWFNGVRSPLMDFDLNGLILGMNLQTKPEEIYLSLIEATAYGTRLIIESFLESGSPIQSVILSGGIPLKNPMLVQVYADVCNCPIRIASGSNASAKGAAICGVAAADPAVTGFQSLAEAAAALGDIDDKVYLPNPENTAVYDQLYREYVELMNYFGKGGNNVMKRLNAIRNQVRSG